MVSEQLLLKNQVCYPFYATSRLITKAYKPYLDKLGITYPQYLVLLVLWETNTISVQEISEKLLLNTNTLSPLLQRMEKMHLIERNRSKTDERKVIIQLTENGILLKEQASCIPEELVKKLLNENIKVEDLIFMRENLNKWMNVLNHP